MQVRMQLVESRVEVAVEAHGGQITATSPGKGQGTTISMQLPLMIVHDRQTPQHAGRT